MKHKIVKILIFFFLLLYFSGISSFYLPNVIPLVIISAFGLVVIVALKNGSLKILLEIDLLIILLLFVIYIFFQQKLSIWDNEKPKFHTMVMYSFQHLAVYILLTLYAFKSYENAVFLTNAAAFSLLTSYTFFLTGILSPELFINLRYVLYKDYIDNQIAQGLFAVQTQLAGLSSNAVLFGYQIAGGTVLLPILASINRKIGLRVIFSIGALLTLIALFILAERSIILALISGFFTFFILSPKRRLTLRIITITFSILIISSISAVIYIFNQSSFEISAKPEFASSLPTKLLHERFDSGDISTRVLMQVAAIKIISDNPSGLFTKGLPEEDWGYLANEKGYEVVPDANGKDFALVHNGYLRLTMYFGLILGFIIFFIIIILFRKMLLFKSSTLTDTDIKKYGRAVSAMLVALLVQALFHNDSLFTFERVTLVSFCLFSIWISYIKNDNLIRKESLPK